MNKDKKLKIKNKIGLAGAGYWGKNLVRVFNELGVLKTVCDLDKNVLAERKKDYPNLELTNDFSDMLEDKEIKGVVIATPAVTHYNLAKKAILAGKDVFIEKPLALTIEDGKDLVLLAEKKKAILMVGHLLLYHPAVEKIKEMLKRGDLGEIRYIYSNRLNFGKIRVEENVLWSFAPHDIAIMISLLGMPKRVRSIGRNYLQKDNADTTLSFLEFEKEKAAHIFVSWLNPFKEQKLSIVGEKAMVVFDDRAENKLVIYFHKVKNHQNKSLQALSAEGKVIAISNKEPLLLEAKHFLDCIQKRKKPLTDGAEALEVLKVLDACQKSLDNNGIYEKI